MIMKSKLLRRQGLIGLLALLACLTVQAQQLAFPGAQGWGRFATGGRSGRVYHVTNLNDTGAGSLRDAVSQSGRIVVFDVAGVINLQSRLVFAGNLYVAGQTAPGEGVTVYGNGVSFSGSNNIIVRYMRFRMGKGGDSGKDCAGISNGTNMIFDHCSFAWGLDEVFSINPDGKGDLRNVTLMNCVFGQGLLTHSAGGLMQADSITLYRNFYCDNGTRNNKVKGAHQYVNNIVYNWKNGCYLMGGDSQGKSYANTQGNLFINGPAGGGNACTSGNSDFNIYADDNWQDKDRDGKLNPYEIPQSEYGGGPTFRSTPYPYPELNIVGATSLIDGLLPDVGASLPYRDYVDCYMVDECLSFGTDGVLISTEDVLPFGKPSAWKVWGGNARVDTDGDGMPDEWETANGTDPAKNDAMTKADNGYTNIENYVNSISADTVDPFLRAPQMLGQSDATPSSITLTWRDWTVGEEGFFVQMERDGEFVEVGRVAEGVTSFVVGGLEPAKAYRVRVCAYSGDDVSEYTMANVKTMQEQTDLVDIDNYQPDFTWKGGDGTWDTSSESWKEGVFADGGKVLFPMEEDAEVYLPVTVAPKAVVVNGPASLNFMGGGKISGTASVNKAGTGSLSLSANNDYTGATVLRGGEIAFSSLKNGGVASSIGASLDYSPNWVWYGGTWRYTGGNTSTNRGAVIYKDTEFNVQNANTTVSMGGKMEGDGGIVLNGAGTLAPTSKDFFSYAGNTTVKGGTLYLNGVSTLWSDKICDLGGSKLVLAGGSFRTKDPNDTYSTYTFPIEVAPDSYSKVYFCRNCSIKSTVTGTGTVEWEVNWVREYIEGDWRGFYGTLVVNGSGSSSTGSQLMFNNNTYRGMPNNVVYLKGSTRIIYWNTNGELYLGGLGGDKGTFLSGSSKQTAGHVMTWHVGAANTDETFGGVIDNCASNTASKYDGTTNIVKEGSGIWRLTGTNTYKGYTNVNGGQLIVNGKNNGTGKVSVNAEATLAGTGTVAGAVAVNKGGVIRPGDEAIGESKLTLGSTLTVAGEGVVSIPATRENCNTIAVKGVITLQEGAVLQLADGKFEEAPYNATAYQVFDPSAGIVGTFAEIIPAVPGEGQTWDVSELYTTGVLKVVGGEENPNVKPEPNPEKEMKTALLTWGNMSTDSYDNSGVNNMLVGVIDDDAEGFSMVITGNLAKYYSAADKINVEYNGNTLSRTTIKCSNGAENTVFLPEKAKATKITLWSYTNVSTPNRTSYWANVAGVSYTKENSVILQASKDTSSPVRVSFDLPDIPQAVTFRNTGEQQCVIVGIDYYIDNTTGITDAESGKPMKVEYFNLSGERMTSPAKGVYVMKVTFDNGRTSTQKVIMR